LSILKTTTLICSENAYNPVKKIKQEYYNQNFKYGIHQKRMPNSVTDLKRGVPHVSDQKYGAERELASVDMETKPELLWVDELI
jgi:hypothetical protein